MRGDLHLIGFPEVAGRVLAGPHPAVIVSSDRLNRSSGTMLVCPLTSRIRHDENDYIPPYLVKVTARASGLDRDGWVKADQVFTWPSEAMGERIGRLNPETVGQLDAALAFVLDL